jgi:hypothetical protein
MSNIQFIYFCPSLSSVVGVVVWWVKKALAQIFELNYFFNKMENLCGSLLVSEIKLKRSGALV